MILDELKKLHEDLVAEESKLRHQLNQIANKSPVVKGGYDIRIPNYGNEEDENYQEGADLDRNMALARELESRLSEIVKTKKKIEEGSYGKCDNCSQDIPLKRLQAMPVAVFCINCARIGKLS